MVSYRTDTEEWVLKAARQYARMKAFGIVIDVNGNITKVAHSERDAMADLYAKTLLERAQDLMVVMSLDASESGGFIE